MSGIRGGIRVRRMLLVAGVGFVAWPAGLALAATTVGQTGTPMSSPYFGSGAERAQNDAAMPTAGVITSFQTQSINSCSFTQQYDFQVLRPLGGNQYRVLGDTGTQTSPCDGNLHSYPVNIPVQAGDVLGVYVAGGATEAWQGILSRTSGSENWALISLPAAGDTVTLPSAPATETADESATLVTAPSAQISSPAANQTFGLNQSVQTTFSCTEASGGPGIQSCADSRGTAGTGGTTETLHGGLDTSTAGAHTYAVKATSQDGLSATATINYTVATAPVVSISTPANGASYRQGQIVDSSFTCKDGTGGPGIASCLDQNGHPSATAIDTSTAGPHAFSVTATSGDGQSGSAIVAYTVGLPTVVPLTISAFTLHPASFKASKGTTLNLTLSAAATVKAVIFRSGRKLHGKCKATVKTGKGCTIQVKTLTFAGVAGRNHFKINTKGLKPSGYTLLLTASSSTGTSGRRNLTFKIKSCRRTRVSR